MTNEISQEDTDFLSEIETRLSATPTELEPRSEMTQIFGITFCTC